MEISQLKEFIDAIIICFFLVFCIIGVTGGYIVSAYKTSLLDRRLKESIATLEKALSILSDENKRLAQQKTVVIVKDKETGQTTLHALNTSLESEVSK